MTVANGERQTSLELTLAAQSESVGRARHEVADYAREYGADPDDVALAVSEAVSNAVIHAFRGREPGRVVIHAFADGDMLVIGVSDDGVGVSPNPDSPGLGLGLALIGSLAEGVELRKEGPGTTLIMRFPRSG